jgi:hypothetical protein
MIDKLHSLRRTTAAAVAIFVVPAAPVHAGALPAPSVEYSADRTIQSEAGTFTGKIFVAHDKERSETQMGAMNSVVILRRDLQRGWLLMPAQHSYQTLDLAHARQQSGAADGDQVDIDRIGPDTAGGYPATRYRLQMRDGSASGLMWLTAEGIPVKMETTRSEHGHGRGPTHMTVTLGNLHIAVQDPQLFEVPEGYHALPAPGQGLLGKLGGFGGGAKGFLSQLSGAAGR